MALITNNKLKHCKTVAEYMYIHADERLVDKEDMYTLGLLHDIGYLFGKEGHNKSGGKHLRSQGYKYWCEVYFHGSVGVEYKSYELDLLNKADMMVNKEGKLVGYDERLKDIKARYGETSEQYLNAVIIVKDLKDRGV